MSENLDKKVIASSFMWAGIYAVLSLFMYIWFAYGFQVFKVLSVDEAFNFYEPAFFIFIVAPLAEFVIFKVVFIKNKVNSDSMAFFKKLEHTGYTGLLLSSFVVLFVASNVKTYDVEVVIMGNDFGDYISYLVAIIIFFMAWTKFTYAFPLRYELTRKRS